MEVERELIVVADGSYTNGDFRLCPNAPPCPQGRYALQNARAGAQNRTPTKLRARDSHARTDSQTRKCRGNMWRPSRPVSATALRSG